MGKTKALEYTVDLNIIDYENANYSILELIKFLIKTIVLLYRIFNFL